MTDGIKVQADAVTLGADFWNQVLEWGAKKRITLKELANSPVRCWRSRRFLVFGVGDMGMGPTQGLYPADV